MMHKKRTWSVSQVASVDELADKLVNHTWTTCSGFYVAGHSEYYFLNDSTSEDGAAEFAVVRTDGGSTFKQVESITFSWCTVEKAREYILRALAGEFDADGWNCGVLLIDASPQHRCHACA